MPPDTSRPVCTSEDPADGSLPADAKPSTAHLSVSDATLQAAAAGWEPKLDLCCPNPARIRDFLLGGMHAYALEKTWCEVQMEVMPTLRQVCYDERAYLLRAVDFAIRERGIRRFLVIGGGLPYAGAVHDLVLPHRHGRVVYADNDACVIAHLQILASEEHMIACIPGDFLVPGTILFADPAQDLLAADAPICLVLSGVLEAIADTAELTAALQHYVEHLPAGSLVAVTHATVDGLDPADPADNELAEQMRRVCGAYADVHMPARHLRTSEELQHILGGLDLIEPGITFTVSWHRASDTDSRHPAQSLCLAAVATVPGRSAPGADAVSTSRCAA